MHIHYLALQQLASWLGNRIWGYTLVEVFSQQKDELVLGFGGEGEDMYLRVACGMPLPHIWPVENYRKAKKNVVELFVAVIGQEVSGIEVVEWDRILRIQFSHGYELVCKMHGSQSNALLLENGKVAEIFRQQKADDRQFEANGGSLNWDALDPIDMNVPVATQLKAVSPALGKEFAHRLANTTGELRTALESLLEEAVSGTCYIGYSGQKVLFSLFQPLLEEGTRWISRQGIFDGLNSYFRNYFLHQHYRELYQETQKAIAQPLKKARGQAASHWKNLDNLESKRSDEEIGHILMANLHQLTAGRDSVTLHDFYHDAPISIKLKPELNPQQNAERYYQKQKKRKTKRKHLESMIEELEKLEQES